MCDLKATEMNVQHNLIQELTLYQFELAIIQWKEPKTFVAQKVKAQLIMVIRWFKKFCLRYKSLDNRVRLGRPKIVKSKGMPQAKEANLEV